jgi:ketosteroid isomerase-like protein
MTKQFKNFELKPREGIWLRRNGDRAIVSVYFEIAFEDSASKKVETGGQATLVCERRDGAWFIVHEHTSFSLMEDRLGGEAFADTSESLDHVHPRDPEFQKLIDEYLSELAASRGASAAHADAPARFFASDADVLVWDPTSRRPLVSWSSVAAHRDAPDLRIYLTNKVSRGDVRVWKSGDMAWATFTFSARATRRDGRRFEVLGRQTNVFQKLDGAWKIVHEHASVPLGPEGTPAIPAERAIARTARTSRAQPKLTTPAALVETEASKVSFEALAAEYAAAWSVKNGAFDENRIARLYAPEGREASRTFVDGVAWTFTLRRQMWTESMEEMTLTPAKDLTAIRRGNVAWTTNTQNAVYQERDGTKGQLREFQSAVWEFKDGRWLIVSEHVSVESTR